MKSIKLSKNKITHLKKYTTMKNLTKNQQSVINELTETFIRINEEFAPKNNHNPLFDFVAEIETQLQADRKIIAEVNAGNEIIIQNLHDTIKRDADFLKEKLAPLNFDIEIDNQKIRISSPRSATNTCVSYYFKIAECATTKSGFSYQRYSNAFNCELRGGRGTTLLEALEASESSTNKFSDICREIYVDSKK